MPRISIDIKIIRRWLPFLAAALTFAVFLPALKNGFVNWDDTQNLLENRNYRGLGWEQLKWMFTTFHMGPYQPLSWVSLGFDYLVWGMNPFGYHLTSVVLHSANALVFCLVCARLLAAAAGPAAAEQRDGDIFLSAGFAALFFAVHPLRVESVAWATERRDVLSGLFYLLAILWYILPRSAAGEEGSFGRRHLLPLAAFILALLSKGVAVSLPAALVLLDIYPLRRLSADPRLWFSRETAGIWLEKVPFLALAAVFCAAGYFGQAAVDAGVSGGAPGFGVRVLPALTFYVWKTLFPFHLSPFYARLGPAGLGADRLLPLSAAAFVAITAVAAAVRRRRPAAPVVWIFYLAALSPALGVIKFGHQPVADRYTYLPCLGFAALAGGALWECRRAPGRALRSICLALACLILCGLIFLTWRQEKIWRDSESLHRYVLTLEPRLYFAHSSLGGILHRQGKLEEAAAHYLEAVRINPDFYQCRASLGDILVRQGDLAGAALHYREALRINPDYAEVHTNLGNILAMQGRFDEARDHYKDALRVNPGLAQARYGLETVRKSSCKPNSSFRRKPESKNADDTGPRLSPGRRKRPHRNGEKCSDEGLRVT